MPPAVSFGIFDFDPNFGITELDPANPRSLLYFVCAKSVHDPSFEVCTTPESYPPSSVAGEPYHSQI